ncbi:hypothetical protein N7G274_004923 [Stereocaulon virgatum]|uniref:H/ACA ribonucleoprotein complex non-core subunit NAF1 n=1 Tax=Stereocaulon virgatum TaxID=373712 RepID=A0ABR4AAH3_9LECA
MDRAEDFEMPSPKRARLDAQELDTSQDRTTGRDDMDELYTSPSSPPIVNIRNSLPIPALAVGNLSLTTPKFPQLPGLSVDYDGQQPLNEAEQKERPSNEESETTLNVKLQQATIGAMTSTSETQKEVVSEMETAQESEGHEATKDLGSKSVDTTEAASTEPTFEALAEVNKSHADAEFELDSSPLDSSSSDVSSDTSSSDDDSDVDDYEMLSPDEQARRLMAEDGGSDDGRAGKGGNPASGVLRTTNEKPDEVVPKPNITVTADMRIEELGRVENLVENLALIKANTSGEHQVLESGSVLCLEDRSVIGVIAETLGRVQQPYYSVRFTNTAAMTEAGISRNTRVFYVEEHSSTVFTQPLKAFKGSDASNLHDEEVGDDELEFSDDEAEAEHKRQVKLQKRARHGARDGQTDGFSRGSQQRRGGPNNRYGGSLPSRPEHSNGPADLSLNYDDGDGTNTKNEDEDLYTPLARPSNLHEMMAGKPASFESNGNRGNSARGGHGGARGGRQRHRGNRGSDRGGKFDRREHASPRGDGHHHGRQSSPPMPQRNGFGLPPNGGLPPRPPHQNGHGPPSSQNNGYQPQPSPTQASSYPHQLQATPYPSYPSQYPNNYAQAYSQPQQHQGYPSQYPQQQHNSQYYQTQHSSPQSYPPQQSFPLQGQYSAVQTPSIPPSPAHIPPGAHINPAFFQQQAQSQPQAWQQPDPEAARKVQESLNLLRGFGGGGGYAPT